MPDHTAKHVSLRQARVIARGATWDDKRLFLILVDDRLLGLIDVVLRPTSAAAHWGLFLIHPDNRRRGVGTAVARELLTQARGLRFDRVTAPVAAGLEPGESFVRSLGFTIAPEPVTPATNRVVHSNERPIHRATLHLAT